MRRSFEGLCGMVREVVQGDPVSGHLFLFLSRNRSAAKILFWDRTGFVIWYKKLERGTFTHPERGEIDRGELMCVLEGLDPKTFSDIPQNLWVNNGRTVTGKPPRPPAKVQGKLH